MIEQSAQMAEEASARSTARLSEGVAAAKLGLSELERLLGDIDARAAALPRAAQAQAQAVRESVERSIADLLESTRRSAEETQAIDAAFQDRVRRNYDMLSEAVRLMGVVAGAAGSPARPPAPRPAPTPAPTVQPAALAPAPAPAAQAQSSPPPAAAPVAEAQPAAPRQEEQVGPAGLRPRLKLTPTASDEEFKTVFDAAGGREAPQPAASGRSPVGGTIGDSWTWKELLSSMDEGMGEGMGDDKSLADMLLAEIGTMGIDAGALLPRVRIDQIAAAVQAGETAAGREIVRRLAPAAVRRLARRMIADRGFRNQADRYVRRYQAMIAETKGDGQSFVVAALLGSDQGRAFLLFDAAVHEGG